MGIFEIAAAINEQPVDSTSSGSTQLELSSYPVTLFGCIDHSLWLHRSLSLAAPITLFGCIPTALFRLFACIILTEYTLDIWI